MSRKTFILDTNVLLFDPTCFLKFGNNDVVIPLTVFEEIDSFKRGLDENARNARHISRLIDDLRSKGSLLEGVALGNGGTLIVDILDADTIRIPNYLEGRKADNAILAIALKQKEINKNKVIVFVTKDTNLRIKADLMGLQAEDYEPSNTRVDELHTGVRTVQTSKTNIDKFYKDRKIELKGFDNVDNILPNEYLLIKDRVDESHTALGRYDGTQKMVLPLLKGVSEGIWGIQPRNVEQIFAFDMLLNDEFKLVSLVGKAGTGKTLLALTAGLSKTIDDGSYTKILVSRPVFPLGKDIGYLPGDIDEKLSPWMSPIFDNLEYILGSADTASGKKKTPNTGRKWQELINQGMLNIEPLTYIRGRSIANQYLVVDEAQNLTPHEMKTIITRAGNFTKIVLTGDRFQIDNPYIDSTSNGLTYVVERFKEQKISAHITLEKGERSELAEIAANLL